MLPHRPAHVEGEQAPQPGGEVGKEEADSRREALGRACANGRRSCAQGRAPTVPILHQHRLNWGCCHRARGAWRKRLRTFYST
jgi:hypothetical protein